MQFETIVVNIEDGVGQIWFNRPEIHNGFNEIMIKELNTVFELWKENESVEVVIIRGKGKSYSAGADLNWLGGVKDYTYEQNLLESQELAKCFHTIYSFPKPIITVAHGASIGGANGFLAASAFAVCENNTKFSLSEVKIGVVPACIAPYVFKRIGEYNTLSLMLSGRRIDGEEAEQIKLVNKSLPFQQLENYVGSLINQLKQKEN
jgi:methylglutaconyl-CoA hydratase